MTSREGSFPHVKIKNEERGLYTIFHAEEM